MNEIVVMKFGGTSVGDATRLREVVQIARRQQASGSGVVLVCSALAGVTNSLFGLARAAASGQESTSEGLRRELWTRHRSLADALLRDEWEREALFADWAELLKTLDRLLRSLGTLRELSARALDAVVSLGERWSVRLIAALLREQGMAARAVDATELFVTDDRFGAARPLMEPTGARIRERLAGLLSAGITPVVTGYIGATREGVPTTLGRGGSDYSAAIVGASLGASEVQLWTDVNGILTGDPKLVPQARTLAQISYVEATELATFGAEVLHPKTIAPVAERGIPLRILNTFNPEHPGTLIVAEPELTSETVRAIISTGSLALLTLHASGEGWTPELAARALGRLAETGVEVLMLTQSFSERSLTLVVRQDDAAAAQATLELAFAAEIAQEVLRGVRVQAPVATVSVVGAPVAEGSGLVARTFAALGQAGSRVLALAQSAAAYHVSFVLPQEEVTQTVRTLHAALGLED